MPMVTSCVLVQLTFLAACVLLRNFSRFSLRLVAPLPDGSADGAPSDGSPEVQLSCGALHGTWSQGVAAFRGIRYGQAPLRQQRFRPARAAACQAGDAMEDGNSCLQGGRAGANESEDCLNLNVFLPSKHLRGTAKLPVIVWIYGGSNIMGSVEFYGPIENLVRQRDCVLVAMNYRLGIFGNLALRELAEVDPRGSSGNLGITDQQLALQWVQQNIAAFGGDPEHVTLLGQSSGGTNILAHLASESSRGLFHRAISLSGSPNITMDRQSKEDMDRRLILPNTPCAGMSGEPLLECLYTADAHTLDKALPMSYKIFDVLWDYPNNSHGIASRESALLYVDGVTVSAPVEEALRRGINDVPILLQSMQAEMDCAPAPQVENLSQQGLRDFFHQQFAEYGEDVAKKVYDIYGQYQPPAYAAYAVDADTATACGFRQLAQAAGNGFRSPVFWSTVTASPSKALKNQRFPYHNWDFTAASRVFSFYDEHFEADEMDLALGDRFRADWFDLILHGEMFHGWKRVQDSQHGEVIGSEVGATQTQWHRNHKAMECDFWKSIGVDQRWWWIN
ncbi:unnamed protein product [Cladocopium goreaui]|uniref:Carboxylic ester hydrolase n=1 Tax=Cladocopium goreaui TaxID=2562237 RepID=A0A9P1C9T7_9DINO|nr:unnamed protein product [Cladocopium goreaui]